MGLAMYDKDFETVCIDDALVTLLAVLGLTSTSLNDIEFYDDPDWNDFNEIGFLWKNTRGEATDDIAMMVAICTMSGKWSAVSHVRNPCAKLQRNSLWLLPWPETPNI